MLPIDSENPASAEREENLSCLIGEIYDAALNPATWPQVLSRAADFVGGQAAGLLAKDTVSKLANASYHVGVDPRYIELYEQTYWRYDPLSPLLFFGIGEVTSRLDYMSNEEFLESRFYREWAGPQGWIDSASVVLEKSATNLAILSFLRSDPSGMVDDEMRRRVGLIFPHVRRTVLIGNTIELKTAEAASLTATLDGIGAGMFLIDDRGRIVHANLAGSQILSSGNVLTAAGGRLVPNNAEADFLLKEAFATANNGDEALGSAGIALPLIARDGERYVAHVLPLTAGARRQTGSRYAATTALFVHKAALATPSPPELIAKAYGLTPAELRVLLAMVEIDGVSNLAEALGVSENTVHTHLRRLFGKTGTKRQAELVKLIAGFSNPLVN
jgi:DNA-binding CsgD family transcriptional regulator